jgi:hypothetical protein
MTFPTFRDLFNAFSAKVKEIKPDADPTVKGSWAMAFGRGIAAAAYSLVILSKEILRQFNPITSTGEYLDLWASYDNITRLDDSVSTGQIWVYGANTTTIPASTEWSGDINGLIYSNTVSAQIAPQDTDTLPISILSLTRVTTTATADCSFPHGLATGDTVKLSGASPAGWIGSYAITIDPSNTYRFTFTIAGSPTTPATGDAIQAVPVIAISSLTWDTGVVTVVTVNDNQFVDGQEIYINDAVPSGYTGLYTMTLVNATTFTYPLVSDPGAATTEGFVQSVHAVVNVQSTDSGPDTVVDVLGQMNLSAPISGVQTIGYTPYGIQGGAVAELDDALKARLLLTEILEYTFRTLQQIVLSM